MTQFITLTTRYVEGDQKTRSYKTLEGARKAAQKRFGTSPERGGGYVHDDYAVLYVHGCTFDDLFPDSYEAVERRQKKADEERFAKAKADHEARMAALIARTYPIDDDVPF